MLSLHVAFYVHDPNFFFQFVTVDNERIKDSYPDETMEKPCIRLIHDLDNLHGIFWGNFFRTDFKSSFT